MTKAVSEFKALEQSLQEEEAKERIKENGGGLEEGIEGFNIRAFFEESVRQDSEKVKLYYNKEILWSQFSYHSLFFKRVTKRRKWD